MNDSIFNIYSLAAYEFQESHKKWMPQWLTQHPAFERVKKSRIFKIFSMFGLNDFRETFNDPSILEDFKDFLISNFSYIVKYIISMSNNLAKVQEDITELNQLEQIAYKLIQEVMKPAMWATPKHRLTIQVASEDKRLRIDAGTSIVKAYNIVRAFAAKLDIVIMDMETSLAFKNYSKRGTLTIVFSTKPEDIAGMSSRSDWESCQTLDVIRGLNACVIGSTLSKFVGIVYITAGQQFEGRGEKMLSRCLIRFVIDTRNNKPAIIIDKMYPSHSDKLMNIIREALQSKISIPVYDASKTSKHDDFARFRIPEEKIQELNQEERSNIGDNKEIFSDYKPIIQNNNEFFENIQLLYMHELSMFLFMKMKEFFDQYNMNIHQLRLLAKKIIINLTQNTRENMRRHFNIDGRPIATKKIKKLMAEEMIKPLQKITIKNIIDNSTDPYLPEVFIKDFTNIIYEQIVNMADAVI